MRKIDLNGKVMYEDYNGERRIDPEIKPDTYGAKRVDVDGKIMWETKSGERVF